MKEFIINNKYAVGGVTLVIIALVIYYGFFTGTEESAPDTATTTAELNIGGEVGQLREQIRGIQLSKQIFDTRVFNALEPFNYVPAQKSVGRQNPFESIIEVSTKHLQRVSP